MRSKLSRATAALMLAAGCALIVGLATTGVQANVYATDLAWGAPAVDANVGGASVDMTFRLNEPADVGVTIDIYRSGTDTLVRTIEAGPKPKGLNTVVWDLKDNSAALVTKNAQYYFKVTAKASGYASWTQISDDNEQGGWFEWPQALAVNTNPNSAYLGRVYVIQARDGTPAGGAAMLKGLYMINSDNTRVGTGPYNGDQVWAVSATFSQTSGGPSPFKVKVGADDKVYLSDWSDTRGGAMVAPPDLSGTFKHLLNPTVIAGTGGQSVDAAVSQHGSVSDILVVGKGLNRKLYTIDEDLRTADDLTVGKTNGSIWRYDIGPLDQVYPSLAQPFWIDGVDSSQPNRVINFSAGLARDAEGNVYISQYRSNGTDQASLLKIAASGNKVPLWQSLANWGSPDPLRGARGTGVAVDDARNRIAFSAAEQGVMYVFNKNLDLTTLTPIGGGAIAWVVGATSTANFASNALTGAFAAGTVPAGLQLNDISADSSSATAGTVNGYAVGDGGNILKVTGRTTYASEVSPTTENLYGVAVVRGTGPNAWAVGANGTIVKNVTGSWEPEAGPVSSKLNAVGFRVTAYAALPAYDVYVVGDNGVIIRRLDVTNATPTAWETQSSGVTNNLNDISMLIFAVSVNTSKGFVVGDGGTILKTLDGGTTWTKLTSGTTANLKGVSAVTATNAWAVGDGGLILRTRDGAAWESLTSGTTANLKSVFFKDTQNGWAAGDGGVVLRTRNGGTTWAVATSGTTQNLKAVYGIGVGSGAPRGTAFDAAGNLYESNNSSERIRVYSPPDGPNQFTSKSAFQFVPTNGDATKPGTPVVSAPVVGYSDTQLNASWTATGASYEYAIGVTAEDQGDYVVGWTPTANTSVTKTGLSLTTGLKYFFYVRAKSTNGVYSDVGISAGTLILAPTKIGQAKASINDGGLVVLKDVAVTKVGTGEFWVQEGDRSAGVRVVSTAAPTVGNKITLSGTMGTSGPERFVTAAAGDIQDGGDCAAPGCIDIPLGTVHKVVGGRGVKDNDAVDPNKTQFGIYNDGLLVKVWGAVTDSDFISSFYLDDGSDVLNDSATVKGLKVDLSNSTVSGFPSQDNYLIVTGIVRLRQVGGNVIAVLEPRTDADIVTEQ